VVTIAENLSPGDLNGRKVKNTSASPLTLFIYFASSAGQGWTGFGITLQSGEEKILDENDFGAFQPFFNVQNQSGSEGSLEVTGL